MLKKIVQGMTTMFFIIVCIVTCSILFMNLSSKSNSSTLPSIMGYSNLSVLTGSMRPHIHPGDMILIRRVNPQSIRTGDIITYRMDGGMMITHRVIDLIYKDGKTQYRTRGDANNVEDAKPVAPEQIIGIYVFRIPYGGYITSLVRSPVGFTILFLFPVVLIIAGEIIKIRKALWNKKRENLKHKVMGKQISCSTTNHGEGKP